MDDNKILKNLLERVEKLEKAILGDAFNKTNEIKTKKFKGATGGLRFLISKGFFEQKKNFGEIKEALASHGYHYSKQAIQTPLNNLTKTSGLLVSLREAGKKIYVKRK